LLLTDKQAPRDTGRDYHDDKPQQAGSQPDEVADGHADLITAAGMRYVGSSLGAKALSCLARGSDAR